MTKYAHYETVEEDVKTAANFPQDVIGVKSRLTAEQVAEFNEKGYLVVPDFATREQLQALARAAEAEVNNFDADRFRSIFSTDTESQDGKTDDYFLDSGDCTRCFFEDGVFDTKGQLKVPKLKSINKIGHAMHDVNPVFRAYSQCIPHRNICASLGYTNPVLAQSMYIFKQPYVGGKVGCHQDNTFLYTTPTSCTGLWIALDDATQANGCMWVIPGSHKGGTRTRYRLRRVPVSSLPKDRAEVGTSTEATVSQNASQNNENPESSEERTVRQLYFDPPVAEVKFTEEGGIPVEVKAGSLVLLHGDVHHYSYANTSPNQRHAYTLHVVDGSSQWAPDNWMQTGAFVPLNVAKDTTKESKVGDM